MVTGTPFAMISSQETWLLRFPGSKRRACIRLVVILRNIAGFRAEIADLQENAVFIGELLLETSRKVELIEIVVDSETTLTPVICIERIAAIAKNAVLGCVLDPIAVAKVLRA